MTTILHVSVAVRWLLNMNRAEAKRSMKSMTRNGKPFNSVQEFYDAMQDELAAGHEMLPMSPECDRHDWKKGCLGHEEIE